MKQNIASIHGHPGLDERQAAERELCRLFKSFGIDAPAHRGRLIDPFLERAAMFWRPYSGADFAVLAVQEARADLESWFTQLLGERLDDRASAIMAGRAAYLMCSGPSDWADQLLMPVEDLPEAFVDALIEHTPSTVPPSELGEMQHQPYEAWSPTAVLARAFPAEGGLFQSLGWRSIGTPR